MKKWNKVIALLLIAVLIVCGLAVSPSSKTSLAMTLKDEECSISEATTSGTAVSMEPTVKGLIRLIEANRLGNIDMNSYGEVQIEAIEKNMDPLSEIKCDNREFLDLIKLVLIYFLFLQRYDCICDFYRAFGCCGTACNRICGGFYRGFCQVSERQFN